MDFFETLQYVNGGSYVIYMVCYDGYVMMDMSRIGLIIKARGGMLGLNDVT